MKKFILPIAAAALMACTSAATPPQSTADTAELSAKNAAAPVSAGRTDTAIFAGGCFWCVESDFEKLDGVIEVVSGYTGGDLQNPTYRAHGQHVEGTKIIFNPDVISYDALLTHYWTHVDPTDSGGQFCDRGHAYIPVIYARPDQQQQAEDSKAHIIATKPFPQDIAVPILPAKEFWDAEEYHQDYYKKNPVRYKFYRNGCGRDQRIASLWGQ